MNEMQFYILENDGRVGPFDAMGMIKRIRNGKLTESTLVLSEDADEPIAAGQISIFHEYFHEAENPARPTDDQHIVNELSLGGMMRFGLNEMSENQDTLVFAGAGCLVLVLIGALLAKLLPIAVASLITAALFGPALFIFMAYVLFKMRGQEVRDSLTTTFKQQGTGIFGPVLVLSLLLLALPGVISAFIGPFAFIFLLLTFIVFFFFMLAPFYWADGTVKGAACLKQSWTWVTSQNGEVIGALAMLAFINALACAMMVVPMFVTLPISAFVLADLYERYAIYMPEK
ncbi:MAG: hypothetical protein CMM93_06370 [Rickettsiales bacterium]|nr:hypothetical protein [Rickettsiales bacterium]|tara:strand:+ start:30 stop:890 length:861 start_codon:yes stop_codon:yes gene_type:complete